MTYRRLQISVGKATDVHELQCFRDLKCDDLSGLFCQSSRHALFEVAVFKVFHSNVQMCIVLIPAF